MRKQPTKRAAGAAKAQPTRQRILDAAKELLMRGGPEAVVIRELAQKLGMTHGNLQYYFPTRSALLVAIFDQEIEKYTGGLQLAVASTRTPRERLDAIIDSGLELIRSPETALWRLMVGMVDHSPEMAVLHKKETRLYEDAIARELSSVAPKLSTQRRRHIARMIQAVIDGLSIQIVHHNPGSAGFRGVETEFKAAIFALIEAG